MALGFASRSHTMPDRRPSGASPYRWQAGRQGREYPHLTHHPPSAPTQQLIFFFPFSPPPRRRSASVRAAAVGWLHCTRSLSCPSRKRRAHSDTISDLITSSAQYIPANADARLPGQISQHPRPAGKDAAPIVTVTTNDSCPPTNPLRWSAASLLLIHLSSSTALPRRSLPSSTFFFFSGEGSAADVKYAGEVSSMSSIRYTCTHTHTRRRRQGACRCRSCHAASVGDE